MAASVASSDHNSSLELQFARAAESDNVSRLCAILEQAQIQEHFEASKFLRLGLLASCSKGRSAAATFLLEHGADPNGGPNERQTPLFKAVESNHTVLVQRLLSYGAHTEVIEKKDGRTPLMVAAWLDRYHLLELLIRKGAQVNAKDRRQCNVLHILAGDKIPKWSETTVELLLRQSSIGINDADETGRTPLHWACVTGKTRLAELLLDRHTAPRAELDAVDRRGKAALHFAAIHDQLGIVELLLRKRANFQLQSDGGYSPLHLASESGSLSIVTAILAAGEDVNVRLHSGATPLHLAAAKGHLKIVELLLLQPQIKRAARDRNGDSPFLLACQQHHNQVVELLAPSNHSGDLSSDAIGACKGFKAAVVDFGQFRHGNKVDRTKSVFDLLYARDGVNPRKAAFTVLPVNRSVTSFRWIHLPSNCIAWVETLMTKWFIENGATDIEAFKAIERSFTYQHRGKQAHSRFMRPSCQYTTSAAPLVARDAVTAGLSEATDTPLVTASQPTGGSVSASARSASRVALKPLPHEREISAKNGDDRSATVGYRRNKKSSIPEKPVTAKDSKIRDTHGAAPKPSNPKKDVSTTIHGNICIFMPYLHFETTNSRVAMCEAIARAAMLKLPHSPFDLLPDRDVSCDELLLRAHLNDSTASLHVRRTLDQSFYHNIDTANRDTDQVVYRYQRLEDNEHPDVDPKIFMVDQLWMWILGKDLIVTSFPQRWCQPKADVLNVLDNVIEKVNSRATNRDPVRSVYDLATTITGRCSGMFDRHQIGDEGFVDMFESSVGNATETESKLFASFGEASSKASAYLQHHRRPIGISRLFSGEQDSDSSTNEYIQESRTPLFVDQLLDIGKETALLSEVKDMRDELFMLSKVLEDQLLVLPSLRDAICDIHQSERRSQKDVERSFREQFKLIETHLTDLRRMDKQAERIYASVTDMLDLKQKHASSFEARFARESAENTRSQSKTVTIFTLVTVLFLPLSFIASFFAINIEDFPGSATPQSGDAGLPLGYVSKYIFGIGFAISIPLIVIALSLDDLAECITAIRRYRKLKGQEREKRKVELEARAIVNLQIEHSEKGMGVFDNSTIRGTRGHDWRRSPRISKETVATARQEKVVVPLTTAFRMARASADTGRSPERI